MKRLKRSHWQSAPVNVELILMHGRFIYYERMFTRYTGMTVVI